MSAKLRDTSDRKLASQNAVEMTPACARSQYQRCSRRARPERRRLGDLSTSASLDRLIPYPGCRDVMFYSSKARQPAKSTTISIAIRRGRRLSCNYASSSHNNTAFNDDLPLFYVLLRLIQRLARAIFYGLLTAFCIMDVITWKQPLMPVGIKHSAYCSSEIKLYTIK